MSTKGFVYRYRKKLGLTQKELANKLQLSYRTYLSYEYGTRQMPIDLCIKLLELSGEEKDKKIINCLRYVYYER